MLVYIYSDPENYNFCQKLQRKLKLYSHEVELFETIEPFVWQTRKKNIPDLYILDIDSYNRHYFNPYQHLKDYKIVRPLIFFNDHQKKNFHLPFYYHNIHKLYFSEQELNWENIEPSIIQITNCILALEEKEKEEKEKSSKTECFYPPAKTHDIKEKLSKPAFMVYKMLKENLEKSVSMEELQKLTQRGTKPSKASSISCLISSIRKELNNNPENTYEITKTSNGYMMFSE